MMDVIMVGVLLLSFGILKLFLNWCHSEIEPNKK